MKDQKIDKKPGKVSLILMCLLLAIVLAVNIAGGIFFNVITLFFSKPNIDEVALKETQAEALGIVEEIAGEGIVLLENKDALPLSKDETKVNLFGWSSISPMISGGIGSGSGNTRNTLSYIDAMKNNGFEPNQELIDFYEGLGYSRDILNSFGNFSVDYRKTEAPMDAYSDELWEKARQYSDVAIAIFSRLGNESDDVPTDMSELDGEADEHYLELGAKEAALLDKIKELDFKKTIVIINAGFPFEVGFAEEKGIDAVIWAGGPGQTGMNSLAKILNGEINPSGRLPDTFAYDLTSSPAYANFGEFYYEGASYVGQGYRGEEVRNYNYVEYVEGIYVGYRYYETRYVDNETGKVDEVAYQKAVQYPFGYGISYTQFKQEITDFTYDKTKGVMSVRVTNTGDVPGKDVVQLYVTAPYVVGGIEKSHVSLIGFDKTEVLDPNESEIVTVEFAVEDLASFDYKENGCYVLDSGTYEIKLMLNSHEVVDSRNIEVAQTIIYDEENKRDSDKTVALSKFESAQGDVKYMSRADWEGSMPQNVPRTKTASEELMEELESLEIDPRYFDENAEDIVFADHQLELKDMIGLDYNDPQWEKLLEQLSVDEMVQLIGLGGFATQAVKSVGKPYTIDLDGPTGIFALVNDHSYDGILYPTAVVLASTWNPELVQKMGDVYGREAVAWGVSGIYGPSMNIHRVPFGGRNYEYYSEDGFLSGKIASSFVAGLSNNRVYCYIKHFALYDQTSYAFGMATWSNEQAMREIYLKPFEMCVKDGSASALMSSYNRIGTTWSGACKELLVGVLEDEWGFDGMIITDWFTEPMNANQAIFGGNDLMLATTTGNGNEPTEMSNAGKQAMRKSSHDILYTVANSVAMDFMDFGPFPYWLVIMICVDVLILAGAIVFFIRRKRQYTAWKDSENVNKANPQ